MKKVALSILTACTVLSGIGTIGHAEVNNQVSTKNYNSISSTISVPTLPKTTGLYRVGTTNFDWVDYSRKDLFSSDQSDYRELMVQVWYPIDSGKGKTKETYVPITEQGINKMISAEGFVKQFADINKIDTQVYKDGLLSNKKSKYPIVIFSHGNNQSRWNYQTITRELASHGYIVLSIEHSHFAIGTEFNNGRYISNDYDPTGLDWKKDDADVNELMVKDIQFVISKLEKLNKEDKNFKSKLDLDKISAMGHSLGGAAAARALQVEPKLKSAMDFDGSLIGLSGETAKMTKPFAFIKTEDHKKQLNLELPAGIPPEYRKPVYDIYKQFRTRYMQAVSGPAYDITISGSTHYSFSDNPLLQSYLAGTVMDPHTGTIQTDHISKLINSIILAFLDETLNGKKNTLLNQKKPFPNVTIVK